MATINEIKASLMNDIELANNTTGAGDTTVHSAIASLVNGYGGGGESKYVFKKEGTFTSAKTVNSSVTVNLGFEPIAIEVTLPFAAGNTYASYAKNSDNVSTWNIKPENKVVVTRTTDTSGETGFRNITATGFDFWSKANNTLNVECSYVAYGIAETMPSYIEYEYAKFNGEYLNTFIPLKSTDRVEVEFDFGSYVNAMSVFGTLSSSSYTHLTLYSNRYYVGTNSGENNFGTPTVGKHKAVFNKNGKIYIDDVEYVDCIGIDLDNVYYILGGRISATNYQGYIYSFKIYNNTTNELEHDLVPIEILGFSAKGFFDKVTEKFYGINSIDLMGRGIIHNSDGNFQYNLCPTVPLLTSNTSNIETIVSASSEYSEEYAAYKCFDNQYDTLWGTRDSSIPSWIKVSYSTPKQINAISVTHRESRAMVTAFTLQGSNDDTNWDNIVSATNNVENSNQYFEFENNNKYLSYRLYITANNGGGNGIRNFQLYERVIIGADKWINAGTLSTTEPLKIPYDVDTEWLMVECDFNANEIISFEINRWNRNLVMRAIYDKTTFNVTYAPGWFGFADFGECLAYDEGEKCLLVKSDSLIQGNCRYKLFKRD